MAEAFFRRATRDRFEVTSAGLEPRPVHPMTVRVMREVGIEVGGHLPNAVKDYLGRRSFRYVVMVCKAAEDACPIVWPFAPVQLTWPFDDPAAASSEEEQLARFRQVRDEIEARVSEWAREVAADLLARGV